MVKRMNALVALGTKKPPATDRAGASTDLAHFRMLLGWRYLNTTCLAEFQIRFHNLVYPCAREHVRVYITTGARGLIANP